MEKTRESYQTSGKEEKMAGNDHCQELIIQNLPKERNWDGRYLHLYQGFWYPSLVIGSMISFQRHFQARDTDVILVTVPKSGSTWLQALAFSIANRTRYALCESPLLTVNPHDLVRFLELDIYLKNPSPNHLEAIPSPRIFITHAPYTALPPSIVDSKCRIVYLCRNPLDHLISYWHFASKILTETKAPVSLDLLVDMFCLGLSGYSPFWDHVLGYWRAPADKVLFLKYEDMKEDIILHLKTLADFMGFPFSMDEERQGVIQEISSLCSFDNMKDLEVNKTGKAPLGLQYDAFFRKGQVGDWANYLTPSMAERMKKIVEEKLDGSGLTFNFSAPSTLI